MLCKAPPTRAPLQAKADSSGLFAPPQRPRAERRAALPAGPGTAFSLADVPVHARPPRTPGPGGLPERLKAGVEQLSGFAMDDVRVHRDSPEPARLGALAFTRGSDIHLGPGQEQHLPHEAWHVVQQKQGRVAAFVQMKGGAIANEPGLEREADIMALQLAPKPGVEQDEPTKLHELKEPALSYAAALFYEQGSQFQHLTDKVAESPKTLSFANIIQEEMREVLRDKYHWEIELPDPRTFKFGINLRTSDEVSIFGTSGGVFVGRGSAGEPENTLQDAFDQAVSIELGRRKKAADEKAAKKAAKKANKEK